MKSLARLLVMGVALLAVALLVARAEAQDWSQWRGDHRDATAAAFSAPAAWPTELTKKWEVAIGDGVATPSLVGDRLYVFSRQEGNEIAQCLDAATGKEIWKDSYASEGTTGGAAGFQGPRSSPTVADGKVVTLGVRGILSCLDAATGKVLWRKDDFAGEWPMFYTSSSPIVVDGLCIAELGGDDSKGAIVAYDLKTGDEKWRAADLSPSYGSPMLMEVDGTKVVIAPTANNLVGIDAADGKLVWKILYTQDRNTSATPIVDGQTLLLAGPGSGMSAIALTREGGELKEEQLWTNTDNSMRFSTPVLKNGVIFGLSNNSTLFSIKTDTHETAWSAPLGGATPPAGGPMGPGRRGGTIPRVPGGFGTPGGPTGPGGEARPNDRADGAPRRDAAVRLVAVTDGLLAQATETPAAEGQGTEGAAKPQAAEERPRGDRNRQGGGRRGRGGRGGYGSIVAAGSVLLVLTPASELVVFEPSAAEFKELARYKVAATPTYAYPIASGKRIFTKDQDNVTLWTVE
jgi:outer membrane protein assembly factor BamB